MNLMNNCQMYRGNENPIQHFALIIESNHENSLSQVDRQRDFELVTMGGSPYDVSEEPVI